MEKKKIHPLILMGLAISAVAMEWRAFENYELNKEGYGIVFFLLGVFFAALAVYGWMRNQRLDRYNRRVKKGQKLIR
jgi:cobalamin biosynthesis protein CobD/CbiB